MPETDHSRSRSAICISLHRAGDVYEVAFDEVHQPTDTATIENAWLHKRRLRFAVVTPDEIYGKISERRVAQVAQLLLDDLWYLARKDEAGNP